jgi:hypothetical protein
MGTFAEWQPVYARHGVATFPVEVTADTKKPRTAGYLNTELGGSTQLAAKFGAASSFGFACGARNRVTVVDMDDTDPAIVKEGERLFGRSPLLWRTGGGKFAMAFRHNGEGRSIRPLPSLPIDLLGAGFVVAPPSEGKARPYEVIRGTLADLDRLPVARIPEEIVRLKGRRTTERVAEGWRNRELFKHCRSIVGYCDTLDDLIDAAQTWAEDRLASPLSSVEIIKTCNSVWRYRGGRRNMVVASALLQSRQWQALAADITALALFGYLSMSEGPGARFMLADGFAVKLGWSRRSIPAARKTLLELRIIECVRPARRGAPALYRWAIPHE